MSTKAEQVLDPYSRWNASANDEPVFVLRAEDWRYVMLLALNAKDKGGHMSMSSLYAQAVEMKAYSDENTIPF